MRTGRRLTGDATLQMAGGAVGPVVDWDKLGDTCRGMPMALRRGKGVRGKGDTRRTGPRVQQRLRSTPYEALCHVLWEADRPIC